MIDSLRRIAASENLDMEQVPDYILELYDIIKKLQSRYDEWIEQTKAWETRMNIWETYCTDSGKCPFESKCNEIGCPYNFDEDEPPEEIKSIVREMGVKC